MKIKLVRYSADSESTLGLLFINDIFQCYTLEDQYQKEKVMHETRIPEGTYKIILATWGNHHERYSKMFSGIHKGMLLLENVPNFTGILIHLGNTDDHSSGCILVGLNPVGRTIQGSKLAYEKIYPQIANAIEAKEPVTITLENIEKI